MSKYILEIRDKDPQNDIELECSTAMQGYKVKIRKTRKRV